MKSEVMGRNLTTVKVLGAILLFVITFFITLMSYKLKNIREKNIKTVKCVCGGVSSFLS